jgi:hypothetical protein
MPCGYPLSCVLLASLILLGISTEASPPQAGCAALHEQAHQRAGFFGAQPEFSARLLLRGGGDAPGGEDAAAELVERIRAGGKVRLEAGDHFCGEDDGVIRVVCFPAAHPQANPRFLPGVWPRRQSDPEGESAVAPVPADLRGYTLRDAPPRSFP